MIKKYKVKKRCLYCGSAFECDHAIQCYCLNCKNTGNFIDFEADCDQFSGDYY